MRIDEVIRRRDIDPRLMFKCIFIMGSPGSGKSTFAEDYLGLPKEFVIADLDKVMSTLKIRDYNEQNTKRGWSLLNRRIRRHWATQGLPLAVVTTGKDLPLTVYNARFLQAMGYDVFGLYVLTELQTAIDRAQYREKHSTDPKDQGRKTDVDYIEDVYDTLSKVRNKYDSVFWNEFSGFAMALNTEWVDPFSRKNEEAKELIDVFLNQPLYNKRGRKKLGISSQTDFTRFGEPQSGPF
jgi:shikimate kinase